MAAFPTSTTVLDSILFRDAFGTPRMREVFSDFSLVSRYAEVEVALAKAEARCGVIPPEAAAEIAAHRCLDARFRSAAPRDRHRRLSDPAAGAPDGEAMRRGRPLCPLGRDHAGHHGHRRRPAGARRACDHRAGYRRAARHPRRSVETLSRHADGRTHPSAAGAAGDVRLQDRDLARDVRPSRRAPRAVEAARAGRPVRRRRRHAGLARRQGIRGAAGAVRGARPRRSRLDLACRARRACRSREFLRARHRLARQDRARRHDHGLDRIRRALRAVREGTRRVLDHAAEAQSDLVGTDARGLQGRAPACRPDAGCDGAGFRARHRTVARRMDGDPGKLRADRRRAASGEIRAGRPDRRREEDGGKSRHQPRADRRRSRDDGARAADRPAGGA